MTTYAYRNGNIAGIQSSGNALSGVNDYEIDFAEVHADQAVVENDLLTIALLPKGALLHGISVKNLVGSNADASALVLQDGSATVMIASHSPVTAGTITGPTAGTTTYFGGGTAAGLHNVFLAAETALNIKIGATAPSSGKIRVSVAMSDLAHQ